MLQCRTLCRALWAANTPHRCMSGAFRNLNAPLRSERSIWISKYSSVTCSRRQLEWTLEWEFTSPLMRHCASTIVQRCITLGKTSVYSTGRQNFGLKYGSKFLMQSLQDLMINWWNLIFPIPNPHQPPLTFFWHIIFSRPKNKSYIN